VKSVKDIPFRFPSGPVRWEDLASILGVWQREILAEFDIRNAETVFSSGLVATTTGVTLGAQALPSGRTVGVPALFTYIGDAGRAASQRFLWPITAANRNSVQSAATILTATSGGANSTIAVAAHSVKFDFGSVAYNSGSIAGLTPETTYYVYADDPTFAGGAVSYLATTNPDNLIAQGRYYLGFIETPFSGDTRSIDAATNAAAVEFTTDANHGWTTGQSVTFDDFTDANWTAFNTTTQVITVTALDKFTVPVNTTTYGAYTSGGTATRVTTAVQTGGGAGAGIGGYRWDYVIP